MGVGGFLRPDLAVLFKFTGFNVPREDIRAGVGGPVLHYWFSDRIRTDVGIGFSAWDQGDDPERSQDGWGLQCDLLYSLWHNRHHSLQVGLAYAGEFVEERKYRGISLVFGWQLL
jgi:hypothetical protein